LPHRRFDIQLAGALEIQKDHFYTAAFPRKYIMLNRVPAWTEITYKNWLNSPLLNIGTLMHIG